MLLVSDGPAAVDQFWDAHARRELIGLRTSGTSTGRARVVQRTTDSWVGSFDAVARWLGLGPADHVWIPGPLSATMNLFAACLATHVGATWASDPDGASLAQVTPAKLAELIADVRAGVARPKAALVAGDGLDHASRDRALDAGVRVHHYYGAAELSLVAIGTCAEDLTLFDDVEARIADERLWVRSPWLSAGYASHEQDAPLRVASDGYFSVGDRAELDGQRLRILGRDGHVTTAGQTVALAPVQARLAQHCAGSVRLVGVPHPSLGQVLTCFVDDEAELAALREWARGHLTGAERPRRWLAVAEWPTTPAGKVDHRELVRLAQQQAGNHDR